MKKRNFLLSVATGVGITVSMLGCSGDGANEPLESQTQNVPARMAAVYAPSTGSLPLPNDLLFGGSTDLTLNIPVEDAENFSDPAVALSGLDGWSAIAPFSISFSSRDSALAVDPSSVVGGSNVLVYKVNVDRAEVFPGIPGPTGPVTSVERELVANQEYVVQATSATSIAVIPTVAFEQQASYMVVLTNGLTDTDGQPILHDSQYAISKSTSPIDPTSSVAALEPVRQLVNFMENAAEAAEGGPERSEIILSFQFTIQSVGAALQAAKAVYIDGAIAAGATPVTSFSSLGTDTRPFTGLPTSAANLHKGQITLNYMLGTPSVENPLAPLNTFWRAAEVVPDGLGGWAANPFALGNLTYANPLPQINGQETVPLLVSMPKAELCPKPENGYPVAIFQHGITADRTNLIGIADALGSICTAGVAMDLPLHGITEDNAVHQGLQTVSEGLVGIFEDYNAGVLRERTFGMDYLTDNLIPGSDGIVDSSGAHTINLANLLVARDNTRQAILDLLYLEKALAFMDVDGEGTDFDSTNVSYIGHSLGGIVGTGVIAHSDVIGAAAFANPGGGIANMLNASERFGPRVRGGVAGASEITVDDPTFPGVLAQFLFAAQAVLDSSDPINTAVFAQTNDVPTLLLQNLGDSVIPNSVATAPLSGTEPLSRALGLTTVVTEEPGLVAGDRLFTKLNQGLHSTVLSPADASGDPVGLINVTTEMQTQIVSFLASGGAAVQVVDPTLLDD